MKTANTRDLKDRIRRLVIARYLGMGKSTTVAEMVEQLPVSETTVRRLLAAHCGTLPGLELRQEMRRAYSRDYPGMEVGAVRVWTHRPTRLTLASIANQATQELQGARLALRRIANSGREETS